MSALFSSSLLIPWQAARVALSTSKWLGRSWNSLGLGSREMDHQSVVTFQREEKKERNPKRIGCGGKGETKRVDSSKAKEESTDGVGWGDGMK